jgi:hypothetical protein
MNARVKKQYLLKPAHARTNHRMRGLVDQAVTALPDVGVRKAAEFLHSLHVPIEIAVRTLVYPQRRRAVTPPSYGRKGIRYK